MLQLVIWVALGGAAGGALRHAVSQGVHRLAGSEFPWGTLVVNDSGAALIGVLAASLPDTATHTASAALLVGLCGSFTTVSSFSLQTLALMRSGRPLRAAVNVIGSVTLCMGAVGAGVAAGSLL